MLNPRLAGRYAKSLIDLAIERDQLDLIFKDMLFLNEVCKMSRDFVILLKSPVIKSDKKGKILDAITGGRISPVTAAFNNLLLRKNRETFLPEIVTAFIEQYKSYKGIQTVKLTTAIPLSGEIQEGILSKVRSGKSIPEIELHTEVNEEIIGGFILEVGDHLVDASVSFELNNMRKQFQNNDFIYKLR
jgi:F-type H+-transporting ATPase subunit delta